MSVTRTYRAQLIACSRRVGFSLVELLVVITILALLASMLVPSLQSAKEAARKAVCGSNLHQLAVGHKNYETEYRGTHCRGRDYLTTEAPNAGGIGGIPGYPDIPSIPELSILIVGEYASGGVDLFMCPSDDGERIDCAPPGIRYIRPPSFSYTRNGRIGNIGGGGYLKSRSVPRAEHTMMLFEEWQEGPFNDSYAIPNSWDMISQRHKGRGQMAFYDGHSEAVDGLTFNAQSDAWRLEKYFDP